jgi:hypothetical protein
MENEICDAEELNDQFCIDEMWFNWDKHISSQIL